MIETVDPFWVYWIVGNIAILAALVRGHAGVGVSNRSSFHGQTFCSSCWLETRPAQLTVQRTVGRE
jgi:hypothetical protein